MSRLMHWVLDFSSYPLGGSMYPLTTQRISGSLECPPCPGSELSLASDLNENQVLLGASA